jgi:hypothetical protein
MAYAHSGSVSALRGIVKHQKLVILAFSTLLPATALGQFTTFVTPPRPRVDTTQVQATPAQQRATTDSLSRVAITNMKAWVDSAAGDVVVNRTDSAGRPIAATGTVTSGTTAAVESTTVFRDGARAPDTATWLPLMVLIGTGALGVGVVLLRWRPSA